MAEENKKKASSSKKKSFSKKTEDPKIIHSNSAFKRAMTQIGAKSGDSFLITYADGSTFKVECM